MVAISGDCSKTRWKNESFGCHGIVESYGGFLLKFVMVVVGCWLLDVAVKVSFGLGGLFGLRF